MNILKYQRKLVYFLCLFLSSLSNLFSQSDVAKIERITFNADTGWCIIVSSDGSATIKRFRESNLIFLTATAPANSINFKKIYKELLSDIYYSDQTLIDRKKWGYLHAGVLNKGSDTIMLEPVRNIEIWNQLIDELDSKWTGSTIQYFRGAIKGYPLKIQPTDYDRIELLANTWQLTIQTNGSVELTRNERRPGILFNLRAPACSVDFEKIRKEIESNFADQSVELPTGQLMAAILKKTDTKHHSVPLKNIEIWNRLLDELESKWRGPNRQNFRKQIEEQPIRINAP